MARLLCQTALLLCIVVCYGVSFQQETDDDMEEMLQRLKDALKNDVWDANSDDDEAVKSEYSGVLDCDCNYRNRGWPASGGCRISQRAPEHYACKCKYMGFWTCSGSVVHCKDENSPVCIHPDRSYQACLQGEGDCGGYW